MTNELTQQPKSNRRTIVGTIVAIVVAILCVIYMLNPTAGFLEFIPDNLPLVGNVDEGLIMILLLGCLKYLGLDIPLTKASQKS
jgi:uncharacterized membrane protein YkvA (DUF1232 family)